MSLLQLNSSSEVYQYNCGGFALSSFSWVELDNFDCGQEDLEEMVEDCAQEILERHPELTRVPNYRNIPSRFDVIGFRIGWHETPKEYYNEDGELVFDNTEMQEEATDFHFVLRHRGKWLHKPGQSEIRKCDFDVKDPWPHWMGNDYNSPIVWFVRGLRK